MDERKPDCLVVVDYPGFNMRLAKMAQEKGIPIVSYISPSAWAWHKSRAKSVAKITFHNKRKNPIRNDQSKIHRR